MPRPNDREVAIQLDRIEDALPRLRRDVEEMLRKSKHRPRDGYPSSSMGGSGGGTEISRPTENAATALPMFDPTGDKIREVFASIAEASGVIQRAENLRAQVMFPEESKGLRINQTPECVNPNCAVPLTNHGPSGRGVAGRCNPCYDYRNGHDGEDRPRDLVERYNARQEKRREYVS